MKDDTISRQAAIDAVNNLTYPSSLVDVKRILVDLPTVQPERIKGHWIEITSINHTYKCSVCGRLLVNITDDKNNVAKNYPYCHCGADMRTKETDCDYERAVEQLEHDMLYEPTFDPDDGSM